MNQQELNQILAKHKLWLNIADGGVYADLSNTDLSNADLRNADLRNADLRSADLRSANLRNAGLVIINLPIWTAYIHADAVRIGCQYHSHEAWLAFSDDDISLMDENALEWWKEHKPLISEGIRVIKKQKAKSSK